MRILARLLLTTLVVAVAALGVVAYVQRGWIQRQWKLHRLSTTVAYDAALDDLRWFDCAPDHQAKLGDLMGTWGRGRDVFDLLLVRYLSDARSSDALRERFSRELAWRPELLPRWTHYWCFQSAGQPGEEIASVVGYLDTLASTERDAAIPWREVLNLQAVFGLDNRPELAHRLGPDNWKARFQQWRKDRVGPLPTPQKPKTPFP